MISMKVLFDKIKNRDYYKNSIIKIELQEQISSKPIHDYYLTCDTYIADNSWYIGITSDVTKAVTVNEFVQMVETEAKDDCWDNDIYKSRIDSCTEGNCYLVSMDEYPDVNDDAPQKITFGNHWFDLSVTNKNLLTIPHPAIVIQNY